MSSSDNPLSHEVEEDRACDLLAHERGSSLLTIAEEKKEGWVGVCIESALNDPHPYPRAIATTCLEHASEQKVVSLLSQYFSDQVPEATRWRAERLLLRRDPSVALEIVKAQLHSSDVKKQYRAADLLGRLGSDALELIRELSQNQDKKIRRKASKSLGYIIENESVRLTVHLLEDEDELTRLAASRSLLKLSEHSKLASACLKGQKKISELVFDSNSDVSKTALLILARMGGHLSVELKPESISSLLNQAQEDRSVLVATLEFLANCGLIEPIREMAIAGTKEEIFSALQVLSRIESEQDVFFDLLKREEPEIRAVALRALATGSSDAECRQALHMAEGDSDPRVRWIARRGLAQKLDSKQMMLHVGRLPSEARSAKWPFGLPAPKPGEVRRARLPLAIATINLSYNLNLGVLIRSAEAAGAKEIFIVGRDFYHRLAAMGADRWIDITFFQTSGQMAEHARRSGYQLVSVQQSPLAERFDRADYPPQPCLILGSEGPGVPPELCAQSDLVVEIPQRGEIDSLNVATAATLVLWACLAQNNWI